MNIGDVVLIHDYCVYPNKIGTIIEVKTLGNCIYIRVHFKTDAKLQDTWFMHYELEVLIPA